MTTPLEYGAVLATGTVADDTIMIEAGSLGPVELDTRIGVGAPRRFARITGHTADDSTETLTVAWED
jgi:hypothetical protein